MNYISAKDVLPIELIIKDVPCRKCGTSFIINSKRSPINNKIDYTISCGGNGNFYNFHRTI